MQTDAYLSRVPRAALVAVAAVSLLCCLGLVVFVAVDQTGRATDAGERMRSVLRNPKWFLVSE